MRAILTIFTVTTVMMITGVAHSQSYPQSFTCKTQTACQNQAQQLINSAPIQERRADGKLYNYSYASKQTAPVATTQRTTTTPSHATGYDMRRRTFLSAPRNTNARALNQPSTRPINNPYRSRLR